MGGLVVLLRVVIQMLRTVREIETRHTALGASALQCELGKVLCQMAADCAEDPIQLGVSFDLCPFMSEIPDVLAPVLELDEGQAGIGGQRKLHNPCVKRSAVRLGRRSGLLPD